MIARDVGAIGEVVGDAGVLVSEHDNPDVVAELLRIVVGDAELRAELLARGERRLDAYTYERTSATLRDAVMGVAAA